MRVNFKLFTSFLCSGSAGSLVPALFLTGSLTLADTAASDDFEHRLESHLSPFPVTEWINDVLISVFFLMAGLEIKRELVEGELASLKRASLPVLAPFGGAITPVTIYFGMESR